MSRCKTDSQINKDQKNISPHLFFFTVFFSVRLVHTYLKKKQIKHFFRLKGNYDKDELKFSGIKRDRHGDDLGKNTRFC